MDGTAYLQFSDFVLNFRFSVLGYIRLDNLTSVATVFSKDRKDGSFPDGLVARCFISATDGYLAITLAEHGNYSNTSTLTASSTQVPSQDWTLVGFAVQMDNNAVDSTIRFWINDGAHETGTMTGFIFVDDATFYNAYIGSHRSADSTFEGGLVGFLYNFHIYNEARTDTPKYTTGGCHSDCGAMGCTDIITHCIGDYEFTEWEAGQSCGSGCSGKGCVRS